MVSDVSKGFWLHTASNDFNSRRVRFCDGDVTVCVLSMTDEIGYVGHQKESHVFGRLANYMVLAGFQMVLDVSKGFWLHTPSIDFNSRRVRFSDGHFSVCVLSMTDEIGCGGYQQEPHGFGRLASCMVLAGFRWFQMSLKGSGFIRRQLTSILAVCVSVMDISLYVS
jgi:hypothetical protein